MPQRASLLTPRPRHRADASFTFRGIDRERSHTATTIGKLAIVLGMAVAAAVQHRVAPGRAQEAGRQALRPLAVAAAIGRLQQLHRAQRHRHSGHGTELEGVEEHGAEPVQHGPGARSLRRWLWIGVGFGRRSAR